MKKITWTMAVVCAALTCGAFMLWQSEVRAQAASGPKAVITKVETQSIRSPQNGSVQGKGEGQSTNQWIQSTALYSTSGGAGRGFDARSSWQDELTVEWFVLLDPSPRKVKPILLRKTVTYVDVDDDKREHCADVYMRPSFIKRFCGKMFSATRDMKVYVRIKAGGQTLATETSDKATLASKWWEAEPPRVDLRDADLMTRDETPYAAMEYDKFEQIKKPGSTR